MNYYRRILPYLRPYWHLAAVSLLLIALSSAAALLVPWPLQLLVDNVLGNRPLSPSLKGVLGGIAQNKVHFMVLVVGAGFCVTVLLHFLNVINNYVNTKLEQKMVLDFRSDLFEHAQKLSLAFHDRKRSGSLIFAINFQGDAAAGLMMTIPALGQSIITLVGMFWISLHINRNLALLSLLVVPFLYYFVGYYAKHIQERLQKVRSMEGESLSIVHEAISMMRVIVAFGRESHEHRRFREQGEKAVDARVKLTVRQTLFQLIVEMTTAMRAARGGRSGLSGSSIFCFIVIGLILLMIFSRGGRGGGRGGGWRKRFGKYAFVGNFFRFIEQRRFGRKFVFRRLGRRWKFRRRRFWRIRRRRRFRRRRRGRQLVVRF